MGGKWAVRIKGTVTMCTGRPCSGMQMTSTVSVSSVAGCLSLDGRSIARGDFKF